MNLELKNLRPLNGNILVIDATAEEKTAAGIYLPESRVDDIKTGTVLATSSRVTKDGIIIEPEVKEGDKVLYKNVAGAGNCFKQDSDMYRILNPAEILAIVE